MRRLFGGLLAATLLVGCNDGPTGTGAVASVTILDAGGSAAPDVLPVGQTAQLTAVVRDGDGRSLNTPTPSWSSSNAAVASVSSSGLVTARAAGTAEITASAGGRSGTLQLVVCAVGAQDVGTLAVGQVFRTVAACAQPLRLPGGASGADYVVVPFHAATVASLRSPLTITANGIVDPLGGDRAAVFTPALMQREFVEPRPDDGFHERLRERERRELVPRMAAARRALRDGPPASLNLAAGAARGVPTEGSVMALATAATCSGDGAIRGGRVVAVTQRAIVVVDTTNPPTQITNAEYRSFGIAFDTLVHPLLTQAFGEPSDVDKNDRVIIFYTRAVNALTPRGSDSYVSGYFWAGDLFPKQTTNGVTGCGNSNFGEILYMLAPDPNGVVNGNSRSDALVRGTTVSVIGHEYQHLINASRRLYVADAPSWEETWLNEALSHIAEELMFFRAAGLTPRSNIIAQTLSGSTQRQTAFNEFQRTNYQRLIRYLERPDNHSLVAAGVDVSLETRGAGWAFLRYAADRRNGNDTQLWQQLVNTKLAGMENLRSAFGAEPIRWAQDWSASLYADDFVPGIPRELTNASWNHRSVAASLNNPAGSGYQLRESLLTNGVATSLNLAAGASAFLRLGVAPGAQASLTTATNGGAPPSERIKITVVRTR